MFYITKFNFDLYKFGYVPAERTVAYHSYIDCSELTKDYREYGVPQEIELDFKLQAVFNKWLHDNKTFLEMFTPLEVAHEATLLLKITISPNFVIHRDNSGTIPTESEDILRQKGFSYCMTCAKRDKA